jgi:glucose dehydrogenase
MTPPTTGWLTNGGDWFNRRYSPLAQINRDNVLAQAGYRAEWSARASGIRASTAARPR